jgi:hypothetical protein
MLRRASDLFLVASQEGPSFMELVTIVEWMSCSLVERFQHVKATHCFHLRSRRVSFRSEIVDEMC